MFKRKDKNAKTKIQSTQQNIPIRDIIDGIVITNDSRYVKIIEVKPTTYFLKSPQEQNSIYNTFLNMLKTAPDKIQFTSISVPANLSKQLENLDRDMKNEKNERCKEIDKQYKEKLLEVCENSVTRRFFISFEYEGKKTSMDRESFEEIKYQLQNVTNSLISSLNQCGNEVTLVTSDEDPNFLTAEILYAIFNKKAASEETFQQRIQRLANTYYEKCHNYDFYIPIKDYIAPKNMAFTNTKYCIIDDLYYQHLYIPSKGYPSSVIPAWLTPIINSYTGVDVSIYLTRTSREDALRSVRKNINYSSSAINSDMSENTETYENAMGSLTSGQYLKEGLMSGQDLYYMSIMVSVNGYSLEEVRTKVEELKKIATRNDFILKDVVFMQEQFFKSMMPLCKVDKDVINKTKRNVLTEGAASVYPFTTFEMNDPNGIYIGDDTQGGSLAIVDIFDNNKFTNANIFMFGKTGAGKTYALLTLAIRMRIKHIPVYILSPEKEHEFRRVCDAIGGQFIQISAGSPNRINIMEITKKDNDSRIIDGDYVQMSVLTEKVNSLNKFFQLLIKDINIEEKQLLDDAIIKTYERFGITQENSSLYDEKDITRRKYKKMPIISDLKETLEQNPACHRMASILNVLCTGSGASFNGQTNVDLNNPFTVIGLEHLSEDMMPLGLFLAMEFVWGKVKEDRTKETALFIDEWWKLAYNPIAAEYSLEISKIIRAYGGSMIIATQQIKDILAVENGKYGEAVINNCATKIALQMESNDLNTTARMLNLNVNEIENIRHFSKGEAMLIAGGSNMSIKFVASEIEHKLITTNREELKEIMANKLKEKEQMKSNEYIENYLESFEIKSPSKQPKEAARSENSSYIEEMDVIDTPKESNNDAFEYIDFGSLETVNISEGENISGQKLTETSNGPSFFRESNPIEKPLSQQTRRSQHYDNNKRNI